MTEPAQPTVGGDTGGWGTKLNAYLTWLKEQVESKADDATTTEALDGKQPLATMLTKLAALAATLAEGQLIGWSDTLDEPVAVNQVGNSLNASNKNDTGVVTPFSAAPGTIASTAVSATNSNGRTQAIDFQGCFIQTALGTGTAFLALYETTGGANIYRCGAKATLPNSLHANLANVTWDLTRFPIGVTTTTRTFELRAVMLVASGAPTANVANAASNPTLIEVHNR